MYVLFKESVTRRACVHALYACSLDVHKTPKTISTLFTIATLQRCLLSLLLLFNEILTEYNSSLTDNAWRTIICSMDNGSLRSCVLRFAAVDAKMDFLQKKADKLKNIIGYQIFGAFLT